MAAFKLKISERAREEVTALEFPLRRQVNQAIVSLSREPRPARWEPIADDGEGRIVLHGKVILYSIDEAQGVVAVHAVVPL